MRFLFHKFREYISNKFIFDNGPEGFDFSQMEAEESQVLAEDMESAFDNLDRDEAITKSDENVQAAERKGDGELSFTERMLVRLEMKSRSLILAQNAFDDGNDTTIAAKVYEEVSNMTREEAIKKYDLPASTNAGSEGIAALCKLGMNPKNYEDIRRAQRGEQTRQNMDLGISNADIKDIKKVLLGDSYTDKIVKAATGQKELDGYQRVLLAPANAIEGVATGFLKLPSTLATLSEMSDELNKDISLKEIGAKGDVIMQIIDQYFSPAEKVAMVAQFVGEGVVSGGLGGLVSKITKIPRMANMLNRVSKLKFAKVTLIGARLGMKAGTSQVIDKGANLYST